MDSLLRRIFFNNTVQDYLIVAVSVLLVLLFRRYLSKYIAGIFFRLLHKPSRIIQKEAFITLLKGPIYTFLILLVTFLSLDELHYPAILTFSVLHVPFRLIVAATGNAVFIIVFIWLLLRVVDFIALILEQKADALHHITGTQLVVFFKDFFKVIIIMIGIILLIRFTFYKDIAALLAGLGIVGAALALSARESLENLIASFIIFFDKPFLPGDLVKVQSITGTVERIGLRSTRIRTDQKTYVTVPNKQMVDTIIDNLTLRTQRRGFISLEINAATPHASVSRLVSGIEKIITQQKEVENYSVVLSDISKNSFVIQTEYFTGPVAMEVYNKLKQQVNLSVIQLMEEMEIKLATSLP